VEFFKECFDVQLDLCSGWAPIVAGGASTLTLSYRKVGFSQFFEELASFLDLKPED
jgi:hypothetical protein